MKNTTLLYIMILSALIGCKKEPPETIPLSPTELTAVVASESQIDLSFKDNSLNETGFNIERKTGTGSYAKIMTLAAGTTRYSDKGLQNYTPYSYRVQAFNAVGPSSTYSNEAMATTGGVPILTTTVISDTTSESATSGGNITNDGGSPIKARGVVWNTSPTPTVDVSTRTTDGTGTGTFTSQIKGLSEKTKYYVRAYATNTTGTGYGEEISFVVPEPDIYIAGYEPISYSFAKATVWKNGARFFVTDGSQYRDIANSVYVSGNDVYVAGELNYPSTIYGHRAILWKNGNVAFTPYPVAIAYSVYVAGNDVYVAGMQSGDGLSYYATLWKNGLGTVLPGTNPGVGGTSAQSVSVSGGNVYAAGVEFGNAVLWKNGAITRLSHGISSLRDGKASSVFTSGSDVYVAGTAISADSKTKVALYWKNGVPIILTSLTGYAVASSIFVYNNDVYVAGSETVGGTVQSRVWKNGVVTPYANTEPNGGSAVSIFVTGNHVYTLGYKNNGTGNVATLWKDQQAFTVSDCGCTTTVVNSIFVVK